MKSTSLSNNHNYGFILASTGVIITALSCYTLGYKVGQRSKTTKSKTKTPKKSIYPKNNNDNEGKDIAEEPLRILRKAETALLKRTSKLIIVIERCTSDHNYSAILRTAEALGIQHVWLIDPVIQVEQLKSSDYNESTNEEFAKEQLDRKTKSRITKNEIEMRGQHHLFAQNATEWLTIREFKSTGDCIKALREDGYDIWVTDLSQEAVPITPNTLPKSLGETKIALVFGTEAVGASNEILQAADLRIYLPLYGYADSLNLSVATALVLQSLYHLYPNEIIGNMPESERYELRKDWYVKLATQRLYTSSEKKIRMNLKNKLRQIELLQTKQNSGQGLEPEQITKLNQKPKLQLELQTMEETIKQKAIKLVQEKVDHPPNPFLDMRRADEHRNCYVGKKTKMKNCDAWKDMPATKNYGTGGKVLNSVFMVGDD